MIVNDLIQGVVNKLRGRDDQTANIPAAIRAVVLDLTQSYEFEELKTTGPLTNFVQNQAEYKLNSNPFINASDVALTFITSWFVYYDQSGIVTAGVSQGLEIVQRLIRVVEPASKTLGIPTMCCIHGGKNENGVIIVGFMPNAPYATQMRYQRQHPFLGGNNAPFSLQIAQKIYMPSDWQDIIEYAAAEKLCDVIGMNDVGMKYHQKLFGYKDKYGSDVPGLIEVRRSQQDRMTSYNSRMLKPRVGRYT